MIALFATLLAVVTTPYAPVSYACDGSTAAFTVNFPYLSSSDLTVTSTTAAGVVTTLVNGTDFTTLSSTTTTATLTLFNPSTSCQGGNILRISRSTALTQPTVLRQQTSFNPQVVEFMTDRVEMQTQETVNTHATDKGTQAVKDASQDTSIAANSAKDVTQDASITGIVNSIAGFSSTSHAVTDVSSVQALGSTTPRTLTIRFSDSIYVKDYGATGDGTTNDTAAVQAAVTAAAGKTIRFQSGTYKLTDRINISSNTRIFADGLVTLNQTTAGALVFYGTGVSNVEIRGFTMTGTLNGTQPLTGTGNNCGAICFETSGGNITVEKNSISGFFNGITGTNLLGFIVRDNEIQHWRLYAVLASQTSDFSINNNRMHDNDTPVGTAWSSLTTYALGDTATFSGLLYMSEQNGNLNHTPPSPNSDAFWLQFATYGVSATGNRGVTSQLRSSITNNKIYNNPAWDGIMSHDTDGLDMISNNIRNVRNGIDMSAGTGTKFDEKMVIATNYIEDTSTDVWSGAVARNCAIFLSGADASVKSRNVAIVGNVTKGFNRFNSGASATGALCLTNSESTTVSGNQFGNVQNFVGNPSGVIISNGLTNGLTISGNSTDAVAGIPGVRLTNVTGDQIAVTGNTIRDGDGSANALVVGGSTISQLVFSGNATNATAPYSVGTSTITNERVDVYTSGNSNKLIRAYSAPQGGGGCIAETSSALSSVLTNIDLVTVDLSGTVGSDVNAVVEVTAQQSGSAADTDVYRFRMATKGTRNGAANAVWVPAAATNMIRVDTDFASAGVAIAIPKLIWNASTNVATLQWQPQVTFTSYHVTTTVTSFRGVVTCL